MIRRRRRRLHDKHFFASHVLLDFHKRFAIGKWLNSDFAEFDAKSGVAFSSNRDGTLSMVTEKGGQFTALPPVTTMQGARTMALDHASGRIYTVAADTKVNTAVPENDRQRYQTVPGTAKLLVLEPTH